MKYYPKISNLNEENAKKILNSKVEITEKIDGSQFRLTLSKNSFDCGSKKISGKDLIEKQFPYAVEKCKEIFDRYLSKNLYQLGEIDLFMEYLQKERHNRIRYGRVPRNNLYLFSAFIDDKLVLTKELIGLANLLEIEPPHVLVSDKIVSYNDLKNRYLKCKSSLGIDYIEGIIIKNYNIIGRLGFPLSCKFVNKEFREVKPTKLNETLEDKVIEPYITKMRFLKVIQHLKEEGKITGSLFDLKFIVEEYKSDLFEEEWENIIKIFEKEIDKNVKRKTSKWYKEMLRGVKE